MKKIIKCLASAKLAVLILLSLSILICIGTLVESRFDARTAKLLVYDSIWMYGILGLLIFSLIAVIIDRYPWKTRHLAFICAHVGVIAIIAGSWLTMKYGLDGTMKLGIRETSNIVTLPDTELTLFKSSDGESFEKIWQEPFEATTAKFNSSQPLKIKLKDLDLELTEAIPYGHTKMLVEKSNFQQSGSGLRFLITNKNITFQDWMVQRTVFEKVETQAGPLLITMGGLWERQDQNNEIRLVPRLEGIEYSFYNKSEQKPYKQGFAKEGDIIQTNWMNLEFRVLNYIHKASVSWDFMKSDRSTPKTTSALKVRHQNVESWLIANDYLKIFTDKNVYLLSYMNKQVELPIYIKLEDFQKTNYPGSVQAMNYKSHVSYSYTENKEKGDAIIEMNEPLKINDLYFYQASFEETSTGKAKASILSVNHDPGRLLKYTGSIIMCLGIIMLFYFRKEYSAPKE